MYRLIARLLLLVALLGNIGPAALAAASQAHACCVRKAVHSCHRPALAGTGALVMRGVNCCNQACGRAVTSVRWAAATPQGRDFLNPEIESYVGLLKLGQESTESFRSSPARAPPAC
jgi:hypothetical protein